ncbi:MAG: nucleotide exchange factor GrpE [Anderseniella sp.]|jgi:molecular chaperone GrpE|nr:nucleotide exchange factor GrpE [Anderseniella sp.]
MTENKRDTENHHAEAVEELQQAANASAEAGEAASPSSKPEAETESDPLQELREENAVLKDRILRAMAETENLRKRAEREKAEATLYAATNFARDLLSVSDSLSKALEMMSAEALEKADESTRNLVAGIELTRRELLNSFQKHGIHEVNPQDEKFDPNFHQAMFEVPGSGKPNGTVVQVVQTGYKIGERLLRPALVGVAKDQAGSKP